MEFTFKQGWSQACIAVSLTYGDEQRLNLSAVSNILVST